MIQFFSCVFLLFYIYNVGNSQKWTLFFNKTDYSTFSTNSVIEISSFTKTSYLSITNGQATCKSSYSESNGNTASVKITQSLEKHSFLWFWDTVGGEWTTNSKKSSVSFTNYKSGLASGTYRVKSVFTVTTTSGQTETVTVYSAEKTIS